jgi:SAM-dependent methyltransferase
MSTFRDFEHAGWTDAAVCSGYQDRLGVVVAQSVEPLLDAVRVAAADTVLDVATGSGPAAAAAAGRGATVIGVDFSAEQLRRARAAHPALRFEPGEADALPFGSAIFDVVVSAFGVPHFPDPDAFFREARRVLRPAGRLAFSVWAPPERSAGFELVYAAVRRHGSLDVDLPPGPPFFRYADPETAATDLRAAGFDTVRTCVVEQTWALSSADDLVESFLHGTVRAAALLARQAAPALRRIRADVREAIASFAEADGYRVPMPAVLVTALGSGAG